MLTNKQVFYLSICSTCTRIIKDLKLQERGFAFQDIKVIPISPIQLDEMKQIVGSYEALFSRRALKYREWGLHQKQLAEPDYRRLILEEYTFLYRPVICFETALFVGSAKRTIEALRTALDNKTSFFL